MQVEYCRTVTSNLLCRCVSRCTAPMDTDSGACWFLSSGFTPMMQNTGTFAMSRGSCSSHAMDCQK